MLSRREVLRASAAWGGAALLGRTPALAAQALAGPCETPLGDLVGLVPLGADRAASTPFGEIVGGTGLDARRFTDLSQLDAGRLITPTGQVFVRTTAPSSLRPRTASWAIRTPGTPQPTIAIDELIRAARPLGAHLIECSGNANPDSFGLMSVAEWDGVPLTSLVDRLGGSSATGLLVGGLDDHAPPSRSSTAGASWIVPVRDLDRLGAFLAVRMNGAPLVPDHGAPVRLVVPGWYGCAWIKWVDELRLVNDNEQATSQMREFAARTHQRGVPAVASEYEAPVIDLAATPIRVEKRRVDGRIEYRIVGIVWGGDRTVNRLAIRFRAGDPPTAFDVCPPPRTHRTWSLWSYRWRPTERGIYTIGLSAVDPTVRTRRLDLSYYVRRVTIDEV